MRENRNPVLPPTVSFQRGQMLTILNDHNIITAEENTLGIKIALTGGGGMWFWFFMLAMDLWIPLMMIGLGTCFEKHPPRKINAVFGYRTSRSMKNHETWKFAHQYCGKLWRRCGLVLLPVSAAVLLFAAGRDSDMIGTIGSAVCMVQLVPLVGTVFPTERALKKNFDQNGNRR